MIMIVGAVILAAGKSERMKQNKLLLILNNKTLIETVLDALSAAEINEQVVVLGYKLEEIVEVIKPRLGKVKIALNVDYEKGMTSSFQTGLIVISNVDAVFLVLGDQLVLDPNLLKKMVGIMETNPDALIVCPMYKGKKGHPLLFRRHLFGEIMSLREDQTIRDVVHAHTDKLMTVEAPEWSIMDIDTPEDYARINEMIKKIE